MGLRPSSIPPNEGLAALDTGDINEALQRYAERLNHAPLLAQGEIPRRVPAPAALSALTGHFMGFFSAFWLSVSLLISMFLLVVGLELGWFPILFVGLFVVIGILLLVLGIRRGLVAVRLVRHGRLSWAVITDKERAVSTSRDSDGRTTTSVSYNISFMYQSDDGELRFGRWNLQRPDDITDEPVELVVYDPENPGTVEFADTLPGGMRLNSQGTVTASNRHVVIGLLPWAILAAGPALGALMVASAVVV